MKKILKTGGILITGVIVGMLLLFAAYSIPTDKIYTNFQETSQTFGDESYTSFPRTNYYPDKNLNIKSILLNNRCTVRDLFTDSLMISTAAYTSVESPFSMMLRVPRYEIAGEAEGGWFPVKSLQEYAELNKIEDVKPINSYSRYWHGYLVVLKPLLYFFNYNQIRIVNLIIQAFLLVYLFVLMKKKLEKKYFRCFWYSWLFIFPFPIFLTLQYSWVYYILLISLILISKYNDVYIKKGWYVYFFLIAGMVTSYIDLLTYPLITLGVPCCLLLVLNMNSNYKKQVKRIMLYSIFWGLGYAFMWTSKWIIASVVLHENVLFNALEEIGLRVGSTPEIGNTPITPIAAIVSNISVYSNFIYILIIIIGLSIVIHNMIKYKFKITLQIVPFLILIFMPIVWYALLKQHSLYHGVFTYKSLMITVFAGMSMLASTYDKTKQKS